MYVYCYRFKHDISDMDQTTVSEVRSYHHPPPGVHETMIATYMILGYPEPHLTVSCTSYVFILNCNIKVSFL